MMYGAAAKEPRLSSVSGAGRDRQRALRQREGDTLGACEYCGYCNRIACETNAKASANSTILPVLRLDPKFELRPRCFVTKLNYDKAAKRVVSVTYTDLRNGEEYEQPAGIVILSSFVFGNVQQLLLAGIGEPYDHATGKGLVGKNYAYQFEAGANAFFEDKEINPYWGSAGMARRHRRFQRRELRSRRPGLFRRRLYRLRHRRRAADRRPHRAERHAGMGLGLEARHREVVPPRHAVQYPGLGLCQPRQFHGPRPDLQGCARPAAGQAHLQSARQRAQNVAPICWPSWKGSSRR